MNHPLFQYAINKRREEGKKFIYHYTNVESFFLIIKSMSLRLSAFSESDDLNEANIANVDRIDDARITVSLKQYIKNRCSYLSFVEDGNTSLGEIEGTNHPRMWSQYAQKGFGVCLAIDEERFFQINADRLDGKFYKCEPIQYKFMNGADVKLKMDYKLGCEEHLIKQYYHEFFFKKHIDWKEEHEKRLFGIDIPKYLSIYNALEFICLGPKFLYNKSTMNSLKYFISDSSFEYHGYLVPQSFACITPYNYGYFAHDSLAVSQILQNNALQATL